MSKTKKAVSLLAAAAMPGSVASVNVTAEETLCDKVKIYYRAADTNIGLAEGRIDDIIDACLKENH